MVGRVDCLYLGWHDPFWSDVWRTRIHTASRFNNELLAGRYGRHGVEQTLQNMLVHFYLTVDAPDRCRVGQVVSNHRIQTILKATATSSQPLPARAGDLYYAAAKIDNFQPGLVRVEMRLSRCILRDSFGRVCSVVARMGEPERSRRIAEIIQIRLPADPWNAPTNMVDYVIRAVLQAGTGDLTAQDVHTSEIYAVSEDGTERPVPPLRCALLGAYSE